MRQNELIEGVGVQDANGNEIGKSRVAAVKGINTFHPIFYHHHMFLTKQTFSRYWHCCTLESDDGCPGNASSASHHGKIREISMVQENEYSTCSIPNHCCWWIVSSSFEVIVLNQFVNL